MVLRSVRDKVFLQALIFKASEIGDCRKIVHAVFRNQPIVKFDVVRF